MSKDWQFSIGAIILYCVAMLAIIGGVQSTFRFSDADVRPQLELVVGTKDYIIINKSNNALVVGTPGDVTYNLMLPDSTIVSCRCTDGVWQPLICRKYD